MMANISRSKVLLQVLPLSYNVTSEIHGAMTPNSRCIHYLLDTKKYRKLTGTIRRMDNAQRDNDRVTGEPKIGRHRLHIVTTQGFGQDITSKNASAIPRNEGAREHPRAAPWNTPPFFGLRHTKTPSGGLDTHTSIRASLQDF